MSEPIVDPLDAADTSNLITESVSVLKLESLYVV